MDAVRELDRASLNLLSSFDHLYLSPSLSPYLVQCSVIAAVCSIMRESENDDEWAGRRREDRSALRVGNWLSTSAVL